MCVCMLKSKSEWNEREDKDIREAITGKEEEETRKNRRVETTA